MYTHDRRSDRTCRVWDVETGDCLQVLEGHTDEIFSAAFNYEGDTIITGSKARTRTRHGLTARLKPFLLPLAGQHVPHLEELNGLGAGEKIK